MGWATAPRRCRPSPFSSTVLKLLLLLLLLRLIMIMLISICPAHSAHFIIIIIPVVIVVYASYTSGDACCCCCCCGSVVVGQTENAFWKCIGTFSSINIYGIKNLLLSRRDETKKNSFSANAITIVFKMALKLICIVTEFFSLFVGRGFVWAVVCVKFVICSGLDKLWWVRVSVM